MNRKGRKYVFPIEEKLAAIEWNLKLLKTSVQVTHTPARTLKSMIRGSVVALTNDFLRELTKPHA